MAKIDAKTQKTPMKSKKKAKVRVFTKKKKDKGDIVEKLQAKYETVEIDKITKFSDIPLSSNTGKALRECGYKEPTDIQKQAILLALQGKDILGAAQTGSGKTLAFLIPILERLFCKHWSKIHGLGALVITPTRELAYQIFETLRKIGKHHDFSAGLIIGGKDLKIERNCMDRFNIIICTPGRLLQHIESNKLFSCDNLEMLVLDEADRCLDMGFAQTMNAIIASLPPQRQTLLFSATQTKSVKDLVRLSLKDPEYVSVNEFTTPKELKQSYMVCELKDKIGILWSFIKNHPNKKIIVFFACCKQVKYVYEIFCKLRPGTSLMALYGTLHQLRRMDIYETFCKTKSAVLFATDLAARGLDFPAVNWVLQVDCPEDVAMYIHRVGRTARFHRGGESLLLLMPSELKMLEYIEEKKIPIEQIDINQSKLSTPIQKMQVCLIHSEALRDTARRSVICYVRTIFLMRDKSIFDVYALDIEAYAKSLGLQQAPRVRFLQRAQQRSKNSDKGDGNKTQQFADENDSDLEDFMTAGRRLDNDEVEIDDLVNEDLPRQSKKASRKPQTKVAIAKSQLKKQIKLNKKIVFNDEGEAVEAGIDNKRKSQIAEEFENDETCGIDIAKAMTLRLEEDKYDKAVFKAKVKAKHKETKKKLKEEKKKKKEAADTNDDDANNDDVDEFGEDSDGSGPDMSWLPDPDKIYGPAKSEESTTVDEIELPSSAKHKSKKDKSRNRNQETVIKQPPTDEEIHHKKKRKLDKLAASFDVNEAEEIAMMFLKK